MPTATIDYVLEHSKKCQLVAMIKVFRMYNQYTDEELIDVIKEALDAKDNIVWPPRTIYPKR